MFRRIRMTASYACLALGLLFAVSWVDSQDSLLYGSNQVSAEYAIVVKARVGKLALFLMRMPPGDRLNSEWIYEPFEGKKQPLDYYQTRDERTDLVLGFYAKPSNDVTLLLIPLWCPILVLVILAVALRPMPRRRFTLYEFFVITAIVAAVVSGYVRLTRAIAV